MEILPLVPMVDSFGISTQQKKKRILSNRRRLFLPDANILLKGHYVYLTDNTMSIVFSFKDYGVRDIQQIGFTLIITTKHHEYAFQPTLSSVNYTNDNCFELRIIDMQKIPLETVEIQINWLMYTGLAPGLRYKSKFIVSQTFRKPEKVDSERMKIIDKCRADCIFDNDSYSNSKGQFPVGLEGKAWMAYPELVTMFSTLETEISNAKTLGALPELCQNNDIESNGLIPVPINCYFDKGFYSAIYYALNYPVLEKRLSGGKSAIQCIIGVNKKHLNTLMYLFYCTIHQRNFYQYMTTEQESLQNFLKTSHPIMKLEQALASIKENFYGTNIVEKADIILEAQNVITDFYEQLHTLREEAFSNLVRRRQTHGKWVNEAKLFTLIKVIFNDTEYQYSAEWLDQQVLDIFIPCMNCAIEYQGEQHYLAVDYFGGEEKLIEQEFMDEAKRERCHKQNVTLLEWPYSLPINMPNVRDFLKGHVPSEYLNEERLEFQIANFPAENMSAFLKTKKVRIATPKTPIQRVNPNEVRKYDRLGTYLKSYPSVKVAAQQEGLSVGGINKVIYGERKTAGGFQWQRCTVGSPIEQISAIETEE